MYCEIRTACSGSFVYVRVLTFEDQIREYVRARWYALTGAGDPWAAVEGLTELRGTTIDQGKR
jgi:hypothetical protein